MVNTSQILSRCRRISGELPISAAGKVRYSTTEERNCVSSALKTPALFKSHPRKVVFETISGGSHGFSKKYDKIAIEMLKNFAQRAAEKND